MAGEKTSLYPEVDKTDLPTLYSSPVSTEILHELPAVSQFEGRHSQQAASGSRVGRGLLACSYSALCLTFLVAITSSLTCMFAWTLIPQTFHTSRPLHFDYRQPLPSADVWLLPPHTLARARTAAEKWPGHATGPHLLPRGRVYLVSLDLKLPESDHNLQLGMFQVSAEALAVGGEVLAHSTVPCMLRWRSIVIRHLRTIFLWAPLALGFVEEHQHLELMVLRSKEAVLPLAGIRIFLAPKAGLLPSQGLPELYSATLTVKSSLVGLSYLFAVLRWAAAVCTGLGLFVCSILLLLFCCQRILAPGLWTQPATDGGTPVAQPVSRDGERELEGLREAGIEAGDVLELDGDMLTLEVSSLDDEDLKGTGEVLSDEVFLSEGLGSGKLKYGKEAGVEGLRFRPGARGFSRDDSLGGLSDPLGSDQDTEAWDSGEVEDGKASAGTATREARGVCLSAVTDRVSLGIGQASFAVGAVAGGVVHGAKKAADSTAQVTGILREGLGMGEGGGAGAVSIESERAEAHAAGSLQGLARRQREGKEEVRNPLGGVGSSGLNEFVHELGKGRGGGAGKGDTEGDIDAAEWEGEEFEDVRSSGM